MSYEVVSSNQSLTFSPIVFGDEGVYRCTVSDPSMDVLLRQSYTLSGKSLIQKT